METNITPYFQTNGMSYMILNAADLRGMKYFLMTNNDLLLKIKNSLTNPLSAINDVRLYPFDFLNHDESHTKLDVAQINGWDVGPNKETIHYMLDGYNNIWDFGSITIPQPTYQQFLSVEPYSTYQLYLPYIGIVPLNLSTYFDITLATSLHIKYIVDMGSGTCSANLFLENSQNTILFAQYVGTAGVSIPLFDMGNNDATRTALLATVSATAGAMATGDPFVVANAAPAVANTLFPNQPNAVSLPESQILFSYPQYPYLIITRKNPIIKNINEYNDYFRRFGAPTYVYTNLNDPQMAGFTQCTDVLINDENIIENERTEIKNLLESGVFIENGVQSIQSYTISLPNVSAIDFLLSGMVNNQPVNAIGKNLLNINGDLYNTSDTVLGDVDILQNNEFTTTGNLFRAAAPAWKIGRFVAGQIINISGYYKMGENIPVNSVFYIRVNTNINETTETYTIVENLKYTAEYTFFSVMFVIPHDGIYYFSPSYANGDVYVSNEYKLYIKQCQIELNTCATEYEPYQTPDGFLITNNPTVYNGSNKNLSTLTFMSDNLMNGEIKQ